MEISPKISVITNISPNHLNVHKSYEEYIDAKKNIFKHQSKDGVLVLNYDNEITRKLEKEAEGRVIFFRIRKTILSIKMWHIISINFINNIRWYSTFISIIKYCHLILNY